MSTPVYVPAWILEDVSLDVRIGDRIAWAVSPLDHGWFDELFDGFVAVDMEYEYDLDSASGAVSGTVISIQAIAMTYWGNGKPKPNGTTAWPVRSTFSAWNGPATGFIFEVETGAQTI